MFGDGELLRWVHEQSSLSYPVVCFLFLSSCCIHISLLFQAMTRTAANPSLAIKRREGETWGVRESRDRSGLTMCVEAFVDVAVIESGQHL
jgi:hypothetical protein